MICQQYTRTKLLVVGDLKSRAPDALSEKYKTRPLYTKKKAPGKVWKTYKTQSLTFNNRKTRVSDTIEEPYRLRPLFIGDTKRKASGAV